MLIFAFYSNAQENPDSKSLEINAQTKMETVYSNGKLLRAYDNAPIRIIGMKEVIPGENPMEIAKNYIDNL